jgi:hypothetical protein
MLTTEERRTVFAMRSVQRGYKWKFNELKKRGEKLVAGPKWVPDAKTDWPTDHQS